MGSMSEPCNKLSEFGQKRVHEIGEQRHNHDDTPSTPRYVATKLLTLSGGLAGLAVVVNFILAPIVVMFSVATTGTFSFAGWQQYLLQMTGLFVYAHAAKRLADYLGYEDWWGPL